MTLPVTKAVANASLDAAILIYVSKHPGATRSDIECSREVAAILCRTSTVGQATEWLHRRLQHLRETAVLEQRRWKRGWTIVERAA